MAAPRSSRSGSLVTLLVLVSITVLVVGSTSPFAALRGRVSDAFGPVRRAGKAVTSPLGDVFGSATRYQKVRKDNDELRKQLAAAQGKLARVDDAVRERSELLALNGLADLDNIPKVNARVVGQPLGNFDVTIEIDAGSASGIREGMPVVTGAGLVGRVTVTTPHQARVLLITDAKSQVGVRLSRSGDVGVARGGSTDGLLGVDLIDPDTVIADHEVMVTSGLQNSRYPAGIPVGQVVKHSVDAVALQQNVTIKPLAAVDQLDFVQVLLWSETDTLPSSPSAVVIPTSVVATDRSAAPSTTKGS